MNEDLVDCKLCGALTHRDRRPAHIQWHARIAARLHTCAPVDIREGICGEELPSAESGNVRYCDLTFGHDSDWHEAVGATAGTRVRWKVVVDTTTRRKPKIDLTPYQGSWVAIHDDKVVAHAQTGKILVDEMGHLGVKAATFLFVSRSEEN